LTAEQQRPLNDEKPANSRRALADDDPELVLRTAAQLRTTAEDDHRGGTPRGKAYVRRLQQLIIERPVLGVAVARSLGLEHIAEDLLEGRSVDGVPGIGPDGSVLKTRRHRTRWRGKVLLAVSALLLLVEAVTADALPSAVLYAWTAVGLGVFFVGGYLVMLRE
jgi:hypothetical protein